MDKNKSTIIIPAELEWMKAMQQGIVRLIEKLKEARTLADALASDVEKSQTQKPKVDTREIDEDRFWECVARFFAAAHESWCTQKPVDSNLTCTNCTYLQNCADGSPIWYWMTANRILRKKTGIGCQLMRTYNSFNE